MKTDDKQTTSSNAPGLTVDAKWAALIDDRLIPMPQRRLKAKAILYQSGANAELTLVRDFNSPVDIGFQPESMVDLAEGNVFRTASNCERHISVSSDSLPKLAFIVDDHWEVTIQPHQTFSSLRDLFSFPRNIILLRDFESPSDIRIGEDEHIAFADGPVFITRTGTRNSITIIVEGTPHEWLKSSITYAEVVTLFDPNYPQHPEITYSVLYTNGPNHKPEGILSSGASVKVKEGMVFNVSSTGQS